MRKDFGPGKNPVLSAGTYEFYEIRPDRRRGVSGTETGTNNCTESVEPTVLTMGNGLRFSTVDMQEAILDELVAMAKNGTSAEDVPKAFAAYAYKA